MQFAKVYVKSKTKGLSPMFIYKIPPEVLPQIKTGQLVRVPFREKKVFAIIGKIIRHLPAGLEEKKLKSITKLISPQPVINKNQFALARFLAKEYLTSLPKVLFRIIPEFPVRGLAHFHKIQPGNGGQNRQTLVLGSPSQRMRAYLKVIEKALKTGRQVIVVFPTRDLAEYFSSFLPDKISFTFLPFAGGVKERALNWIHIESGQFQIVLGTRSALFAPLQKLGLIIIDDPDHPAHKESKMPKFHSLGIAKYFYGKKLAQIVLGGSSKPFNFLGKKIKTINLIQNKADTKIITSEKSPESLLPNYISQSQTNLIILPSLSRRRALFCLDCKLAFRCPICQQVLDASSLVCKTCAYQFSSLSYCPSCSGVNINSLGSNFLKVERYVKEKFSATQIWEISGKSSPPLGAELRGITLATEKINNLPHKFDQTIIINPEFFMGGSSIIGGYRLARLIMASLSITNRQLIVISDSALAPEISQIFKRPRKWLKQFLRERTSLKLPPFTRLIKLTIREKTAKNLSKKQKRLNSFLKKNKFSCFWLEPKNNKQGITQNLIIKVKPNFPLKDYYEDFERLKIWSIDVDPLTLA